MGRHPLAGLTLFSWYSFMISWLSLSLSFLYLSRSALIWGWSLDIFFIDLWLMVEKGMKTILIKVLRIIIARP